VIHDVGAENARKNSLLKNTGVATDIYGWSTSERC